MKLLKRLLLCSWLGHAPVIYQDSNTTEGIYSVNFRHLSLWCRVCGKQIPFKEPEIRDL
jgi:hypothetical protein